MLHMHCTAIKLNLSIVCNDKNTHFEEVFVIWNTFMWKFWVLQIVFRANAFYRSQFLTSQRYQLY